MMGTGRINCHQLMNESIDSKEMKEIRLLARDQDICMGSMEASQQVPPTETSTTTGAPMQNL
ncbi:hypothetical protein Scep_015158 [Stephania cephalantha]|uniref:Uncharacterized protein n=1 Tax=Stephania cephalantha TaxID=152367 RepID=A0AAP0J2E0_9MAGN